MTRAHAMRRLLEHGPLTWGELLEITGWSYDQLRCVVAWLMQQGAVIAEACGPRRNLYRLSA